MNTSTEPIPGKNIDLESPTHKYVLQSPQGPDKERMFHNSPQITLIYTDKYSVVINRLSSLYGTQCYSVVNNDTSPFKNRKV